MPHGGYVVMVVFWTLHTTVSATSTQCRHINHLPHYPFLYSTATLSKNKLYKYQEMEKMSWHTGAKPVYISQEATQLIFMDSESEEEDFGVM